MEFRAAYSAVDPKLGDYTQWVHWRAPTEKNKKNKNQKKKAYSDGCSRCQMCLGAVLEGVALGS